MSVAEVATTDVNSRDERGKTPLHLAADNNDAAKVKQLLSLGADVNAKDKYSKTPLLEAANDNIDESHFEVLKLLLTNGADPNSRDEGGRTPFYFLVSKGNLRTVQLFLDYNADVKVLDNQGRNLLFPAVSWNKNLEVVQLLVDLDLDVNNHSMSGITPLHDVLIYNGSENKLKIAEILLKNGASVNARDKWGQTPFWHAFDHRNLKIIQLFLNFEPDFSVQDHLGRSLLLHAVDCEDQNPEIFQLLLDKGLDVNHRSNDGTTPLHNACEYENIKIVKTLLERGANMHAFDNEGYTPLLTALDDYDLSHDSKELDKKNLTFILEHSDINVVHHNLNILTFNEDPLSDEVMKMVLSNLALQTVNTAVHPVLMDTISRQSTFNDYYNQCKDELFRAKNSKFRNSWVSFYNLLVDHRKRLKNFAGNKVLIEEFENSNCLKKFPIYGALMDKNVKKAIKRRELYDKSTVLLSNCLPKFSPDHLIIRDILDCVLGKQDLLKFCDQN